MFAINGATSGIGRATACALAAGGIKSWRSGAARMAARAAAAEMKESTVIRVFPGGGRTPLVEAVLASTTSSETIHAFRKMQSEGTLVEAEAVGEYLADILLRASNDQISSRESWDFNNPEDRIF